MEKSGLFCVFPRYSLNTVLCDFFYFSRHFYLFFTAFRYVSLPDKIALKYFMKTALTFLEYSSILLLITKLIIDVSSMLLINVFLMHL